jgi:hypothetical protein
MFDHTTLIARDDPELTRFQELANLGLQDSGGILDLRTVEAVGCEKFAEQAAHELQRILTDLQLGQDYQLKHHQTGELLQVFRARYPVNPDVKLVSVEVFEHGANSAIYFPE